MEFPYKNEVVINKDRKGKVDSIEFEQFFKESMKEFGEIIIKSAKNGDDKAILYFDKEELEIRFGKKLNYVLDKAKKFLESYGYKVYKIKSIISDSYLIVYFGDQSDEDVFREGFKTQIYYVLADIFVIGIVSLVLFVVISNI